MSLKYRAGKTLEINTYSTEFQDFDYDNDGDLDLVLTNTRNNLFL